MTCKHFAAIAALAVVALPLGAASGKEEVQKEKLRHVWPILVAPHRIPEFRIKENGVGDPVETKPYETPPADLAVRKTVRGGFEKTPLGTNHIGDPVAVAFRRFELGTPAPKPGKKGGREHGEFKPFASVELPGERSAVCFFPADRRDWRNVSGIAVSLDGVKPEDGPALVFNVATAPVMLRLSAGDEVVSVAPGTAAFVPRSRDAEGMMPVKAVVIRRGRREIVANTVLNPPRGVPVLVFLDSDSRQTGATATFLRGGIDPDAVKPVPGKPEK